MTPREMFADARRKRYTIPEMARNAYNNLGLMIAEKCSPESIQAQRELVAWMDALMGDSPEDQRMMDIGVLDWRFRDGLPFLVTLNGETVGEVSKGRAACGFYWRVYNPVAWIIEQDPEAVAARDGLGQEAVNSWGGPLKTRPAAVQRLLTTLHTKGVALFQVDDLMIPPFRLPR